MQFSSIHRSRNPERDQTTDLDRLSQLSAALGTIIEGISGEQSGLRKRYEADTADACFLELAEDGEGVSGQIDTRLENVTSSIIRSEKRLEALVVQQDFLHATKSEIEQKFNLLIINLKADQP